MQGDPIKDSLYFAVSEYERHLNPNISENDVVKKASSARQNPEQYFADTYKKIKGTNIDEATINRVKETTGIQLDVNKLKRTDVNHVDNDKREFIELGKELEGITQQYGTDIEANESQLKEHFNKNIYDKMAANSRSGNLPDYNKTYSDFLKKQESLRAKYDDVSKKRDETYEKVKGNLAPIPIDKFFKDAEKTTKGDIWTGNNAREVRQNAYLDSERYFGLLTNDFQEKQSKISNPLEQQMASLILEGKKPEIPENFVPTKEFKDWAKSFENLSEQKSNNISVFGTEIGGKRLSYNEQLEEHRSIQEANRDENQNWFTKGKDKYTGKYNIPSITRTWVNGAVLKQVSGIGDIMDPTYTSNLEKEAENALKENNYDKYLKVQKQLAIKDFTDAKGFQMDTGVRSDITAPVWERYVEVDGHRIAVDQKGNVQRVVTDKGFTVHNLSPAEKNAISKYQQNPKGFKIDEGFGKSWGKSVINMAGTSAVEMIPMIVGGMASAPLRSFGMAGKSASAVVSSAPMFTNIYGQEFKQHFAETGDWTQSSTYATAMAGVESLAEWAGGITPAKFTDALAGRPAKDIITAAGRRAATAATNARGIANFSFAKEFVTQLAKDVGQEEAEELFTMFAQNTIQNVYGKDSEIDMNEVLSTVLVTPLATAPFSIITNAANYRTPGVYRDMINSAADNFEKTEEIFAEIGSQMSQGKSESQKKKITDELKAKMDLISHVRNRKDFYAGNTAFQNIDFKPNELENIEHFIFDEALAKANGKEVDHSEKIKPIIAAAKKRGLLNAAKEEDNPLVEDLEDPENYGDIDFQENDFGDFSEEEWNDYVDNGNVTPERLSSIAEKIKAKDTLNDRESAVFANNTSQIKNILKGVKEDVDSQNIPSDEFPMPEVDVAAVERRKTEKQFNRLKKQEYLFNGRKDKDGFVSRNTVGVDGAYESISNDFEANNSDHRILFNVDHSSAQSLAVEAIDVARQTGIPLRIDIAKADNVTDAPLRVSFRSPDDAKTFHNLMTQSSVYGSSVGLNSANEIGHRLDEKSQYSDKKIKSIEKARHIFDNAQEEDGVYYYNDNGDIVGFTDQEINELAELIDSPKKSWENAASRQFSETVEPIQPTAIERPRNDNRANSVNDSLRNPEQVETRETDQTGFQKIKGKTDLTLGGAFDFKPGERKEIDVFKRGKKGAMSVNEGGQVTFESENVIEELGNIEDIKENTFGEMGFTVPNELAVNKKGQILVGGRIFINPYSHAEAAINLSEDGAIESVDVVERIQFTGQLIKRAFTGQQAIDIATALVINELKYNGDYKTFFENYTPTWEDTRFIPSRLTVDRIAKELMPHFNGNEKMAMETAKMYSMVARNMHMKNPEAYPSPGQYIIDRVLRINDIQAEFKGLMSSLQKMAENPTLTEEERDDLLYEIERINRINIEEEQKVQDSLTKNKLVDEIEKLPLTHVSLDPSMKVGMGQNEMLGTYLSTEVGGNRYLNSVAIESGAKLFKAKVSIKNPYDIEKKEGDVYALLKEQLPKAIGRYIYENNLSEDLAELLMNVETIDDILLENFPDFQGYLSAEVTNYLMDLGYDSFYSRESEYAEGYLVVFDRDNVQLTSVDMKSMIPDENTETLEDLQKRNEDEYNALISGESAERRKAGIAVQDGIVYRRAESLPGITGNTGELTFSRNPLVSVKFKYKLVNIRNIHPSHIQGKLNPMHFIPEAQPKDRSGKDSAAAVNSFAMRPVVEQIIVDSVSPYDGIPVVNNRGEVIQGNNRVEGIQYGYYSRNKAVRDYLRENLGRFGFTIDQAEEVGIDNLFIVRELNVPDDYAIELGNYDVKDMETGGVRFIDPVAISRKIPFETKSAIFSMLFNEYENQTLNQLIRENAKYLSSIIFPLLNTATRNTITTNDILNEKGIEGFEQTIQQFLFDGSDANTALLFAEMPAVVQGGLTRSLPYIFSVGKQNSILPEIQKAILGFSDMRNKSMSFDDWATQIDMFNGGFSNSQIHTPLELKLIQIFSNAKKQDDISGKPDSKNDTTGGQGSNFFKYSLLARPKTEGLMFDDGIGGMSREDAVMEVFKVPYNERTKKQSESRQEGVVENDQRSESEVGGIQNENMEPVVESEPNVEQQSEPELDFQEDTGFENIEITPDVKQQLVDFGIGTYMIEPVSNLIGKVFEGLKSSGLTFVNTIEEWVGIGQGKAQENALDGLISEVNKNLPQVPAVEVETEVDVVEDVEEVPVVSPEAELDTNKKPVSKLENLQDVGQKIGGAKKDLAKMLSEVTNDDIVSKPLSKIFPRPDFKKLFAEGSLSQDAAILLNFIYEQIPVKPRKSYRIPSWAKTVQGSLETTQKILEAESTKDTDFLAMVQNAVTLNETLKRDYELYSETMKGLGFPEEQVNLGGYQIKKFENNSKYNKETGKLEPVLGDRYTIVKSPFIVGDFNTMEDAINGLKSILNKEKDKTKGTKFDIYQDRTTKEFFIGKKGAIDVVRIVTGFAAVKDARNFLKEKQADVQALWDAMKAPDERRMANRERVGTNWRNGDNISSEEFSYTFGFRGVEFGNWVNSSERQSHVNEAYDALMDLSSVLGVSPKALSLNGELGFAFGARGSGKFSAHYEPGKVVINLTKTRGAGSLAHEWWHAMDNYFSRSRGEKDSFITERPIDKINNDGSRKEGVRKEMIDAFKGVMNAIKRTKLSERSQFLDRRRSDLYWSTPIEMSARSFENYIVQELAERNQQNDYLANFKETSEWIQNTKGDIDGLRNYPYPLMDESPAINEALQQFFETIKEDESGKLYQQEQSGLSNMKLNERDVLVKNVLPEVVNGFYSPLEKMLLETKAEKLPAKQWIDKFGKGDEAKWTGLTNWLGQQQGSVTKADIQQYLKDNRVSVVEVVKAVNEEFEPNWMEDDEGETFVVNPVNNWEYKIREGFDEDGDPIYFLVVNGRERRDSYEYMKETIKENIEAELRFEEQYSGNTKYFEYQLEGDKENYKEVLVTMPNRIPTYGEYQKMLGYPGSSSMLETQYLNQYGLKKVTDRYKNEFKTSHWDEPNILVHLRMNTRYSRKEDDNYLNPKTYMPKFDEAFELIDEGDVYRIKKIGTSSLYANAYSKKIIADNNMSVSDFKEYMMDYSRLGKAHPDFENNKKYAPVKILFLEEIQSDWGQKGKKEGFAEKLEPIKWSSPKDVNGNKVYTSENEDFYIVDNGNGNIILTNREGESLFDGNYKTVQEAKNATNNEASQYGVKRIPQAPFVTDTNAWTKLGLKVALKEAVKQGADKIAWATGEQQNDRYDLSKQVDEISTKKYPDGTYTIIAYKDGNAAFEQNDVAENRLEEYVGKDLAKKISDKHNEEVSFRKGAIKEFQDFQNELQESYGKAELRTLERYLRHPNNENSAESKKYFTLMLEAKKEYEGVNKDDVWNSFRGVDLKVGGKGMKGFYGSPTEGSLGIVGNVAKSLFKQEPGTLVINSAIEQKLVTKYNLEYVDDNGEVQQKLFDDKGDAVKFAKELQVDKEDYFIQKKDVSIGNSTQHSIDITPELKASVSAGLPLFKDANAQYRIESGKNIIEALQNFDGSPKAVTAITHEIMHPTVVAIFDGARDGNEIGARYSNTIVSEYNKANPGQNITVDQMIKDNDAFKSGNTTDSYRAVQEFIAESWEKYHYEGKQGFATAFQEVLNKITEAFRAVYASLSGTPITPELRRMFDEILGRSDVMYEESMKNYDRNFLALGRGNARPGDYVFNDNGERFEILSYDQVQGTYQVKDINNYVYPLNPDMVNWPLQQNKQFAIVSHPESNVSTLISQDLDPIQREMGYTHRLDISYPMNSFDVFKAKPYFFKQVPGKEDVQEAIDVFLEEMKVTIEEKPVQSVVDEKVIKSLASLKERLQNRKNQAGMQEVVGINPERLNDHPSVSESRKTVFPEYNNAPDIINLNAFVDGVRKFDPKNKLDKHIIDMGNEYEVKVSFPNSLGEMGNTTEFWYKGRPTISEIKKDLISLYVDEIENLKGDELPYGGYAIDARDEKITEELQKALDYVSGKFVEQLSVPKEQISDDELIQIVGLDLFKGIQKQEGLLGEGVVDRNRMMDTARQIQKVDKKDRLLPEHIFESLQHESGYPDNWQDLRNVIEKGGIDINYEVVKRLIQVGVKLPKDIIDEFKKSEQYKNANPELIKVTESLAPEVVPGDEISRRVVEIGSDQGGISDFTANRIAEEDYVEQNISVYDLLASDQDLRDYIENTDEVREYEGEPFDMYPIVNSKGEVLDGYNRIHQMIEDGETEITIYRGIPKTKEVDVRNIVDKRAEDISKQFMNELLEVTPETQNDFIEKWNAVGEKIKGLPKYKNDFQQTKKNNVSSDINREIKALKDQFLSEMVDTDMIKERGGIGQEDEINNILSFVNENQALVDEFFLQKGIDLSELITFTDENGNPC